MNFMRFIVYRRLYGGSITVNGCLSLRQFEAMGGEERSRFIDLTISIKLFMQKLIVALKIG
jgi:hypothetical protein